MMNSRSVLFHYVRTRVLPSRLPFYGWAIIIVAAFATFASGPGQSYVFSVVIDPILIDTGLSRPFLSLLYACGTAFSALMTFWVSRLSDRYGTRRVLMLVGLLFGSFCLGMAAVRGPLGLLISFAALRALGQGSLPVLATLLAAQWFVAYRGRAMAVVMLGIAASNALLPPITQALVTAWGWREAYSALGVMVWVLIIPAAIVIVRDRPESIGLYPDGAATPPSSEQHEEHTAVRLPVARPPLRTLAFWLLALPLAASPFLITALVFHQASILAERNLSAAVSASIFMPFAIAAASTTLLSGFLIERFGPKYVILFNMGLMAVAIGWLLTVSSAWSAIIYATLLGATSGLQSITSGVAWAHYYGRRGLGRVQGAAAMVMITGAAIAPLPLALLQQIMGNYQTALLLLLLIPIVCAALVIAFRPPLATIPVTTTTRSDQLLDRLKG